MQTNRTWISLILLWLGLFFLTSNMLEDMNHSIDVRSLLSGQDLSLSIDIASRRDGVPTCREIGTDAPALLRFQLSADKKKSCWDLPSFPSVKNCPNKLNNEDRSNPRRFQRYLVFTLDSGPILVGISSTLVHGSRQLSTWELYALAMCNNK